jgi:radical SAM protein with 4Fe4S-binding SPASM domain
MIKKGVNFLTTKTIDTKKLLEVLGNTKNLDVSDLEILEKILSDFNNKDFSLLSAQEIQFLNLNSTDMWASYLIFRYKFKKFPKDRIEINVPLHLLIEPVSSCNLRCTMCFQVDESFSRDSKFMGMMDIELFKKIIDDASNNNIKALTLASRGEPTLHPKLGEMLEYCKGKFFEIKINTNATRLNEKLIHQILKNDITDMVFSIDSFEKEEYESIRVLGNFEQVLNNIEKFKEIKEKFYPESRCATRVSGVKIRKSQNTEKFKEFWKKYVDHVGFVEMEERWDTYNNPISIIDKSPCTYLWERMYVWHDGTCNPCDVDYKSNLAVGSIKSSTIQEIWNNEQFTKLRNMHKQGKRNKFNPCDRCPLW